jgi:putative transposase
MREDNLLAFRRLRPLPSEDKDRGAVKIYLNLPSRMKVSGSESTCIADITYIRLKREFVYLAVILDVFSRKVIGWALGRTLQAKLALQALERAIANREPPPGVVHHSDQGVQYACGQYMQKLFDHQMLPSMSRPANPYDNATCESFLKTRKHEEIYASAYHDFEHLKQGLQKFIERYYNRCRLHSALGYRSPEGFENEVAQVKPESIPEVPMMTFFFAAGRRYSSVGKRISRFFCVRAAVYWSLLSQRGVHFLEMALNHIPAKSVLIEASRLRKRTI